MRFAAKFLSSNTQLEETHFKIYELTKVFNFAVTTPKDVMNVWNIHITKNRLGSRLGKPVRVLSKENTGDLKGDQL